MQSNCLVEVKSSSTVGRKEYEVVAKGLESTLITGLDDYEGTIRTRKILLHSL
jgi:hypothetical protein